VSEAIYCSASASISRTPQGMLDHEHGLNLDGCGCRVRTPRLFALPPRRRSQLSGPQRGRMDGRQIPDPPRTEDSQIIIHVRMPRIRKRSQQEDSGQSWESISLGAFFLHHKPQSADENSCSDNARPNESRSDIDRVLRIECRHVDHRVMSLKS